MILTYKYRVKSKHSALLNKQAKAVNFVWNFCNNTQKHAWKWGRNWLSGWDFNRLTTGGTTMLGLHSGTVNAVGEKYAQSRRERNKPFLRYRGKKNLGWIPVKGRSIKARGKAFMFFGIDYNVWQSRALPVDAKIKDGSCFSQDSRGNWYINLFVEVSESVKAPAESVGIDLGLKTLATLSNGESVAIPQYYRKSEERLAVAQRAGKKRQTKNIHAKIANQRRDYLHKASTDIAQRFWHIVVGNVNASALAKTKMAKSVLDAGWSDFRGMLEYKAIMRSSTYQEVSETYTTQTCSDCGCLSASRPRGIAGLGIRQWTCGECETTHDRDINAARNILVRSGHATPVVGAAA